MRIFVSTALLFFLSACTLGGPEDEFFSRLQELCGQSFAGEIVSTDEEDADWRAQLITVSVARCERDEIQMPLVVGEDTSRTWIISRVAEGGLELRHRHLHEDGTPDAISNYGGYSSAYMASGARQEFPASQDTKDLFDAQGIPVSKANTWAMEVRPGDSLLAYEMARPNRFFRIEFDTSLPLEETDR
ncbi:MAG: hypothetical protein AAFY10_02625 [Pseudomonadota bacterium]